jgi:hypothetical protein
LRFASEPGGEKSRQDEGQTEVPCLQVKCWFHNHLSVAVSNLMAFLGDWPSESAGDSEPKQGFRTLPGTGIGGWDWSSETTWIGTSKDVCVQFVTVSITAARFTVLCSQFALTIWIRRAAAISLELFLPKAAPFLRT